MNKPYFIITILWFCGVIYALFTKDPTARIPLPFVNFDKVVHCGLFFGQTWLIGKVFQVDGKKIPFIWILIGMLIFAGSTEVLQALLTKTRQGDIHDFLADSIGVILALYLLRELQLWKKPSIYQKPNYGDNE